MEIFYSFFNITAISLPLIFIFGIVIGSFLNVLIWRLPREESPNGRSHCPHCLHELVWYDLIPVFSFAVQRGRCRYCKQSISFRYPLIEIVTGVLFVLAFLAHPFTDTETLLRFFMAIIVMTICVVVFVIDLEHYLILDKVVFPGIATMLALLMLISIVTGDSSKALYAVVAAIIVFIPFWALWFFSKGKWMGFGDVKFMALMALALGVPGIIIALFSSFMLGALVGVGLIIIGKKHMSSKLPFGTFLTVATVIALLYGQQLWTAYINLFTLS